VAALQEGERRIPLFRLYKAISRGRSPWKKKNNDGGSHQSYVDGQNFDRRKGKKKKGSDCEIKDFGRGKGDVPFGGKEKIKKSIVPFRGKKTWFRLIVLRKAAWAMQKSHKGLDRQKEKLRLESEEKGEWRGTKSR